MAANPREHVSLQSLNTLALPARARYFTSAATPAEVAAAVNWAAARGLPLLVLGGGSNIVLRGDWPGLVLQMALRGRSIEADGDSVRLTVGAGENWHELVQWTLHRQLYGLENLTLIPGTVGAAPIQNIGAYGVEIQNVLECVRGFALPLSAQTRAVAQAAATPATPLAQAVVELSAAQCRLGYRDSIFKNELRGRFIITEVVLKLARRFAPVLDYPPLDTLAATGAVTAERVEHAVRTLRQGKLPDPLQLPNAGSFFKNPVIDAAHFAALAARHPDMPSFAAQNGVKVPAAWLVDRCGWKGRRQGGVGVHAAQALVLVNYAAGADVATQLLELAAAIQADVRSTFDIALELEPTVYEAGAA